MSARGWVGRLSGGRPTSTSQPPPSRPEPGPGRPVRSNGPERTPPGPGLRARPPVPDPEGPALRVVLVSRDNMLAGALRSLIEAPGGVRMLDWHSEELDGAIRHADVVVVDMPPNLHERTFAVIDGRFLGRTVVLLQEGEHAEALPPGPPRAVLFRPLQIGELWAAITGMLPELTIAPPVLDAAAEETVAEPVRAPDQAEVEPAAAPALDREASEADAAVVGSDAGAVEPEAEGAAARSPEPGAAADDQVAAMEGPGLPVGESGLLIGLSGRELEPVVGPGQVAPGMDEETFERLRRWGTRGRQPAAGRPGATGRVRAARAAARREHTRRRQAARAESRQAVREDVARQRAARAEARTAAREQARQAKATQAQQRLAARERSRQARTDARRVADEASRQAKAARAAEQAAAREEAARVKAAQAEARTAAQEQARKVKAARAAEQTAAREAARQAKAARVEVRKAAQAEARQARATQTAARRAARTEARQERSTQAAVRRSARAEARQTNAVEAKTRRAERAEARRAGREASGQARAVRAEAGKAARAEAGRARAARREESRQARLAKAEAGRAARAQARQERAAASAARREQSRQARSAQAQARQAAREEAGRARAARAEEQRTAREATARAKAARAAERTSAQEDAHQAKAAQAEARTAAQEEARQAKAAREEARKATRAEAGQARAARSDARRAARAEAGQARAGQAEARKAARAEAGRERAAQAAVRREASRRAKASRAEARTAARAGAAQARAARAEARRVARAEAGAARGVGLGDWVAGVVQPALVVVVLAAVGVAAAGWRGGPDTAAGEVAVVRAAGGSGGGLVVQDPRVGPIEPLHALAVGAWLRVTEAGTSLEGAVRDARVPSRFLLAGVVGLTMLLFLLLMRVGPGTGAAAGPGPAPPQAQEGQARGRWRLGGAALAGILVALDPLLVRNGRAATGTILAVALALAALALAWGLAARPTLRWLPLVAAVGGLALLVSPLALAVLAAPVAAELLEGRFREAWRSMAALALGIGVWLILPIWVAGQDLDAGQAGWLLGRPPGRGSVAASLADAPLSWLLAAAGLAAAILTWRHRSGARPDAGPSAARSLAWMATTAAGALVAIALGYPAGQALAFTAPAAAVAVALACGRVAAATTGASARTRRLVLAGAGVALAGLLVAQGVDWGSRYGRPADDGLGRLVATVGAEVPKCSAVNASGPDDRARLLAAGATVTEFSNGPAAAAAGVRYFVLTGATATGGPMTPSLAAWVRDHGNRLAAHPSRSLSGVELWRVDAAPLDPVADSLPVPDGLFSNVTGSACGGYRVVDSQAGAFHTAYRAVGGKAVLGRPLGSVWTSDGPALQAFDTMVLGAVPAASGIPAVRPIELPPLLAKLDVEAVAGADIPLPSAPAPVTDRQARALLDDQLIARAYLGTDPATASAEDWRRARDRFGRPLGTPQMMPDGAVRQPFERVVLELPADGGPARPAALGRLAVRLGLVPKQAMRLEPVPGLPARPAETRLDPGPLLRPLGVLLALLALAAGAGAVAARRPGPRRGGEAAGGR